MARIGVSITKSVPFRNSVQEFTNVYYYELVGGLPDATNAAAIIDNLVTKEKAFHATAVTFVRGRLWSQAGSPGANEMIEQHNLSGTGSQTTLSNFDRERAMLFRLRAGVDSRGNPVYLRKWYHTICAMAAGVTVSAQILENTAGFTQASRDAAVAAMASVEGTTAGGVVGNLVSKGGRAKTAGQSFQCHPFLEHHQLGDMWRAQ